MSIKIGIVGLPNVGKSSLFNALTNNDALVANYPFATIEPNLGIVKYLDDRITTLSQLVNPSKTTYSTIDFLDIAGLVKGASKGEGLGNKFLEHIRSVDLICLVVRCFEDKEIISVNAKIDPIFDAQIIIWELIYADLESINKTIKKCKKNDPLIGFLTKLKNHLEKGELLCALKITDEEEKVIRGFQFLTKKNIFFVGNVSENEQSQKLLEQLNDYADKLNTDVIKLNIHQELEISKLPAEEQPEYLKALGLKESAINRLIAFAFHKLDLKNFFTVGVEEVKSWTFRNGWTVQRCARQIHTDIEKGFIKAKIVKYPDFLDNPNLKNLQDEGKILVEGKNYLTCDGDIVKIEFK